MSKIIILLCAVFALAKGHENPHESPDHIENFLKIHESQYNDLLQKYASSLKTFRQSYEGRTNVISVQSDFLIDRIVQTEQYLNPLELLSDRHSNCVHSHRNFTGIVDNTRGAVQACVDRALGNLENLLHNVANVKDKLINLYETVFKQGLEACKTRYVEGTALFTHCIIELTTESQKQFVQNQKDFEYAFDAADCEAKEFIKRAIECYYGIQYDTAANLSETGLNIARCLANTEYCAPCEDNTCDAVLSHHADKTVTTISNPFYGAPYESGCVMLQTQYH